MNYLLLLTQVKLLPKSACRMNAEPIHHHHHKKDPNAWRRRGRFPTQGLLQVSPTTPKDR